MDNFLSFERVQAAQWRGAHMMGCLTCPQGVLHQLCNNNFQMHYYISARGTLMYYLHPE